MLNSVYPVYQFLIGLGAEGEAFQIDDTKNKILDVQKAIRQNKEKRVGIYTTGLIAKWNGKEIPLFFTGRNYAGENLDKLLKQRKEAGQALLMSDALKLNLPKENQVLWANCLTHARRNFWDYRDKYGRMVFHVLRLLAIVYRTDKRAREENLNREERLKLHQKYSQRALEKLRRWGLKKICLKKIEPNEELGEAFRYLFNHWRELTLFLRVPGVPIDNTAVERLLKTPILNRKNSYFYKTQFGALVGDVMMSLIATCRAAKVNAFNYLQTLHENPKAVKETPQKFLPWNFEENFSF